MLLLLLHTAGFLGILVTVGLQLRKPTKKVPAAALHSGFTALLTGFALVAVNRFGLDLDINVLKVGAKLVILTAIVLTIYREQMRERSSTGTILLIGALTIVNMVIAIAV